MKLLKKIKDALLNTLCSILVILAYCLPFIALIVGIWIAYKIANSDMSPWLKYYLLH